MFDWIPLPENIWNPFNDSATQRSQESLKRIPGMELFSQTPLGWAVNAPSYIVPMLGVTNADRNAWAVEAAERIPDGPARNAFLSSIDPTMNRGDIYAQANEARSAGRQADRQRAQERNYFDFMGNMRRDDRSHELNMMNQYANMMGGQAQADAQMRGLEAGLNYNLGMQGLQSNERIAQGNNITQFGIARDTNATQFGIARDTNATQYDIANLQALNNLDVTDAQGWWNTINTGMTTGANVEMNQENARTSRYNTDRNARSNERMAGMQTALQARDIANRQLNFWSQQYAR